MKRRLTAVRGACVLLLLCGAGTGGAQQARAAEGVALKIEAPETYEMYRAGEGADALNNSFTVPVGVDGSGGAARDIRLTIDASALKGVARLESSHCTGHDMVFTCDYGSPNDGESTTPFVIRGVDGAEPGDGGTITYTAGAGNAPEVTGSTRMLVGGPALHTREGRTVEGLEAGESAQVTPAFANRSRFPASGGVALEITASSGLTLTPRYRNCHYRPSLSGWAWCEFPDALEPGTAYETSDPVTFSAGREVLTGRLTYTARSPGTKPDDYDKYTVTGEGPPLTLTSIEDTGFGADHTTVDVRTTAQADYRPITGFVAGRVGDTVEVVLGVRNAGPAHPDGMEEPKGRFEVIPPEGTTVTSIPPVGDHHGDWACEKPRKPSRAYVCDVGFDGLDWSGRGEARTTITFRIRIDEKVPGAEGLIRAVGHFDHTRDNDTAPIPVRATARPADQAVWQDPRAVTLTAAGSLTVAVYGLMLRRRRRAAR